MCSKYTMQSFGFSDIIDLGTGTMRINIVNLFWHQASMI